MAGSLERRSEVEAVIARVRHWASTQPSIVAVAVVGSWSRGTATEESDADLVVVTHHVDRFVNDADWVRDALGRDAPVVRQMGWGRLAERRVKLDSGLEVEFGFVDPSWASTNPIDAGTAEVVSHGGLTVVYDPEGILMTLGEVRDDRT